MIKFVISSVLILTASTSLTAAQNIDLAKKEVGSIITFGCPICKVEEKSDAIELESGTQILEVRHVDGEEKIYRLESWLGGSPVAHVHVTSDPDGFDIASAGNGLGFIENSEEDIDASAVASIGEDSSPLLIPSEPAFFSEEELSEPLEPMVATVNEPLETMTEPDQDVSGAFELRLN